MRPEREYVTTPMFKEHPHMVRTHRLWKERRRLSMCEDKAFTTIEQQIEDEGLVCSALYSQVN